MTQNSKIEWTDHTFNPWIGCQKVGPGCDNCYAESMMADRLKKVQWGPGAERARTSPANWRAPLAWNAKHEEFFAKHGRRQRVFCASLADVFDNAVPDEWRADLFTLIEQTPNLDWLLLTKRIGNAGNMLPVPFDFDRLYPNVWIGATITSQAEADRDIPKLLEVPARVRFLSMEPLLGPVDLARLPRHNGWAAEDHNVLTGYTSSTPHGLISMRLPDIGGPGKVDWVIVGGESGMGARPMSPDWARGLRDQCAAAGVPFLFKQWGEWLPMLGQAEGVPVRSKTTTPDGWVMGHAGKKAAGRQLDGVQHDGFPA